MSYSQSYGRNWLGRVLLLTAVALVVMGCVGSGPERFDVVVDVTDSNDIPIYLAAVTIEDETVYTDEQGTASVARVSGDVTVRGEKPGYEVKETQINVIDQTTVAMQLTDIPGLPLIVREKLNTVMETWTHLFPTASVAPLTWDYMGTIDDTATEAAVREAMVAPDQVYTAGGDPTDPASLHLEPLSDATADELSIWEDLVNDALAIGLHYFEFTWKNQDSGEAYTSTIMSDDSEILSDSIFMTWVAVEEEPMSENSIQPSRRYAAADATSIGSGGTVGVKSVGSSPAARLRT